MSSSETALLDGDIIAYRACSADQQTFDWGDSGGKCVVGNEKAAIGAALEMAQRWIKDAGCRDAILALTPPNLPTFRHLLLPTYKAGRKAKPETHPAVVAALEAEYLTHKINGLEADDVLGILATTDRYLEKAVVVTVDKDLKTVPGMHFNPITGGKRLKVDALQADYWWLMQTLCGDPTDNYKGIPGCGPKRAFSVLGGAGKPMHVDKLWPRVVEAFKRARLTEADALVQARVARILRRQDYDTPNQEVILWVPSTASAVSPTPATTSSPTPSVAPRVRLEDLPSLLLPWPNSPLEATQRT